MTKSNRHAVNFDLFGNILITKGAPVLNKVGAPGVRLDNVCSL